MSPVLIILLIIIAAVAAFFIGRWHGLKTGTKELTQELESKDEELSQLKSGVDEHFNETARLFSNLTEEYKTLYQHLATGANKLSGNDFKLKLSAPVGSESLPSEASAAEVVDAEEELARQEIPSTTKTTTAQENYQEEVFIDNSTEPDMETEQVKPQDVAESDKPDIDIEVTPPKDWADDDMDDDYHPNESPSKESQFTDLASEDTEKPKTSSYEPEEKEEESSEKNTKASTS
ncbi:ZapG family protein [Kangiella shandongensis]|uniref:ZapG family protein n=1 Tax=Kangiella shandongensis TaxID=2763258 RepID=UPI001CBBD4AB|nr:DUF1043 family protein [Kangiella shandongensis]